MSLLARRITTWRGDGRLELHVTFFGADKKFFGHCPVLNLKCTLAWSMLLDAHYGYD